MGAGHKPCALWLLGPTSSGKTTISERLLLRLREKGAFAMHYDGDEVRDMFGEGFGFSEKNRLLVVKALVQLANKTVDAGGMALVSALTAYPDARELVRTGVKKLILIHIECSLDECARRDPKGLYGMAKRGEIDTLVGYNSEYPIPESCDIVVKTEGVSPDDSVDLIMDNLVKLRIITG